jgi:hypothetical protein
MAMIVGGSLGVTFPDNTNIPANLVTSTLGPALTNTNNQLTLNQTATVDGTYGLSANGTTYPTAGPINVVAPVVTGNAFVGATLSCTTGTWTGYSAITYAYQWQYGAANTNIPSATSSTYVVSGSYVGETLRCVVTASNSFGSTSSNSNSTGVVFVVTFMSVSTSGATETNDGNFRVATFTGSGTLTVNSLGNYPTDGTAVQYLVVAGGAGGGVSYSGGGGAGGLLAGTLTVTTTTYTATIGTGSSYTQGNVNGTNSSFVGGSSSLTALGGGGGGSSSAGSTGGSGGGAGSGAGGTGTAGQGNAGGTGANSLGGGGGGGSAAAGGNGGSNIAGNGGSGTLSSISGTATYYAAGGGAGTYFGSFTGGAGGTGGGGAGGTQVGGSASTYGSGSGGGAPGGYSGASSNGIVIIRWRVSQ